MASLRIVVGASLEASALTVYQPLEKAAERARRRIEAELNGGAKVLGGGGPYRTNARGVSTELDRTTASAKKLGRATGQSADEVKAKFTALKGAIAKSLDLKTLASSAERELRRIESAAAKAALGLNKAPKSDFWTGAGGGAIGIGRRAGIRTSRLGAAAYGYAGAAASFARRIGGEIIGGLGVETDLGNMVARGTQQEKTAQQIVNAGYIPGQAGADKLQTKGAILGQARQVSTDTGTDMNETLAALSDFVGKTGDLDAGRAMLGDMAKLARATGSNLADVANAAAEVSNNLGDVPDKAGVTLQVMQQIAGQGKLGAVEMKDLASQMAKIAANAGKFEGGVAKNIAILGVMAQESKLRGGSASATQAATSVTAFASSLTTGATIKHWKSLGMNPFTDDSHTQLSSPDKIIEAALTAAGGKKKGKADLEVLKSLFPTSQGYRAVSGFASVYNEAGGGEAGLQAVRDEFKRLGDAALSTAEIERAFAASMQTSEGKVAVFNSKMEEIGQKLASSLLPAIEALAPAFLSTAKGLVDWVADITGHDKDVREQKIKDIQTKIDAENPATSALTDLRKPKMEMDVDGGLKQVYSGAAYATAQTEAKDRQAQIDERQTQIAKDKAELADMQKMRSGALGVNPGAQGMLAPLMGVYGAVAAARYEYKGGADAEGALAKRIALEEKNVSQMKATETALVTVLSSIKNSIDTGNAILTKLPTAPPAGGVPPGTNPVESPPG